MSELEHPEEDFTIDEPDSEELLADDAGPQTDSHRIRVAEVTLPAVELLPPSHLSVDVEAIVAGQIGLEILPTLPGPVKFAPGRLIEAGKATISTGGSVSTTGLALHRLGITTRLMGKIGDDLFGQAILQLVEAQGGGLARGMVLTRNATSPYSIIFAPPTGERTTLQAHGDSFGADDVRYDLLETAGLFHFGCPPSVTRMYNDEGAELAGAFARAKELGVTTALDLALPAPVTSIGKADWHAILSNVLPHVDVFLPDIEELLYLLRRSTFDKLKVRAGRRGKILDFIGPELFSELGRTLLDMGARIVATKGAGDATIAGFLMGLLRGMTPQATLAAACAVGACSVEAADALSGVKSWPETMERIAAGWPRLKLEKKGRPALKLAAAKWRWDDTYEVWIGPADRSR